MKEFIDKMANNDYVLIALIALLILLVIAFFIVLLCSGKKKNKNNSLSDESTKSVVDVPASTPNDNIDFNHEEYVKETTAEFELTPIADIKPISEDVMPIVQEESPSRKVENIRPVEAGLMNTFSFDELSKMISEELNKSEENVASSSSAQNENYSFEVKDEPKDIFNSKPAFESKPVLDEGDPYAFAFEKPQATEPSTDAFKTIAEEPKPVELPKTNEVKAPEVNASSSISDNLRAKFSNNFGTLFTNNNVVSNDIELPKMASEEVKNPEPLNVMEKNEPVIKDEEVPLFARFNQETYDINKKD